MQAYTLDLSFLSSNTRKAATSTAAHRANLTEGYCQLEVYLCMYSTLTRATSLRQEARMSQVSDVHGHMHASFWSQMSKDLTVVSL
jgi:hypothetical protein